MSFERSIAGRVVTIAGDPVPDVVVMAHDKDLPSLKAIGPKLGQDAVTDEEGCYRITYDWTQSEGGDAQRRGKVRPDICVQAYDGDSLLGQSGVHFNAEREIRIDLTVARPHRSEFEDLVGDLGPALRGVAIADLTDEDLAFLKGETGIGEAPSGLQSRLQQRGRQEAGLARDLLELLRKSARFSRATGIEPEACYAWTRVLDPSDLAHLEARSDLELRDALDKGVAQGLIPAGFGDRIDSFVHALRRRSYMSHRANGQLVDRSSGLPVAEPGFRVHVFDVSDATHPIDLGVATADQSGLFGFAYRSPAAPAGSDHILFHVRILDPNGQTLADCAVSIAAGQDQAFKVPISLLASTGSDAVTIADAMAGTAVGLPAVLDAFLGTRGLRTLGDIRRAGGLSRLADLPLAADHAAIVALEAHVDLNRVSAAPALNSKLIAEGYSSVVAIADAPRSVFVSATQAEIGDLRAAQLHVMARAQCAFLDNALFGAAAAQANGFATVGAGELGGKLFADSCTCEDCESALSPAIYLGDLLDYSTKSILSGSSPIDLAFLTNTLHQPFGDLPISCEAVTQPVHRVRIGIEVLRGYLGARPLPDAQAESDLEAAEQSYLTSAYTKLLAQIGTSYEELRLARTATVEQRQALADRLGIELTIPRPAAPGDELDRLLLDLSVGLGTPGSLAALRALERTIEGLFGLADTTRDPLSDGAKFGDDSDDFISRWQFRGSEWGRNTDRDGRVYLRLEQPSKLEAAVLKVYKDTQRQQLVAASMGGAQVLPRNDSGLSGTVNSGSGGAGLTECSISVIPDILSWRLKHLRTLWSAGDHVADAYDEAAIPLLPLIDPDLIGPDDFRIPFEKLNASIPDQPFDLWLARRGSIDQILAALQQDRERGPDGLTLILKDVFGVPLPDFDGLERALAEGDTEEVAGAVATLVGLNLNVDSFARLMALRAKDKEATDGPGQPVAADEWAEVYSILAQVRKVRLFASWRSEEKPLQTPLILGMRDFWLSLREPVVGDWPVAAVAGVPLIDPDLVSLKDLPEGVAGAPAIQLWNDRKGRLRQTIPQELTSARKSKGYDGMVFQALGTPPGTPLPPQDDLDALGAGLASTNPAVVAAAQNAITNDLRLTLDGFSRLMAVRVKDGQSDQGKKPTAAEYAEIVAILTQARKLKTEYAQWVSEEASAFGQEGRTAGEPAGSIAYWRARKSVLPRWRASAEARQSWRDALTARSARPIIDPDLIDDYDLRDPVSGDAAFDLWQARSADIAARMSAITTPPPTGGPAFDQLLGNPDYLGTGFNSAALEQIDQDRKQGLSIQGRLDQLSLSYAGFDALLRISRLLGSVQVILASEWTDGASILVQSYNQKRFAAWRLEEREESLVAV